MLVVDIAKEAQVRKASILLALLCGAQVRSLSPHRKKAPHTRANKIEAFRRFVFLYEQERIKAHTLLKYKRVKGYALAWSPEGF